MHPLPAQLAQYASQHHASQYAQAKFGPRGSPMAYVPLSVQQPAAYAELVARQTAYVYTPWHLAAPTPLLPSPPPTPPPSSYAPAPVRMTRASPNLADDVLSAMSEPLGSAPPQQLPQIQVQELQVPADLKTSATHPLNVSPLIPPELIVTLSLHLSPAPAHAPTIFAVHPAFALDRLSAPPPSPHSVHFATVTQQSSFSHVQPQVQMEVQVQAEPASPTAGCAPRPALQLWTSAPLRTALSSALSTSLRKSPSSVAPALPASSSLLFTSTVPEETEEQVQRTAMDVDMNADMSVSTVAELPAPLLPPLALPDVDLLAAVLGARGGRVHGHDRTLSAPVFNVQSMSLKAQWDVAMYSRANPIRRPKPALRLPPPTPAPPPVPAAPPMLGNLLLSSCPGKKVRLTGPTRGRAPVSRSLPADLARARALGATLIINCLDDAELSFLGAPWEEYVSEAGKLGISVLRIPIPEGLAPVAVGHNAEGEEKALADFDENLARVLDGWTLRGAAVLVHCRGGVGRAGLIACCWAIRLGLCGPLPPIVPTSPSHTLAASPGRMKRVRMDMTTMRIVEQAIGVVRRRRSLKAVETAEQVSFLVRYVDFLRRRATGPSEALGLAVPA